jgi:hypothetical protein
MATRNWLNCSYDRRALQMGTDGWECIAHTCKQEGMSADSTAAQGEQNILAGGLLLLVCQSAPGRVLASTRQQARPWPASAFILSCAPPAHLACLKNSLPSILGDVAAPTLLPPAAAPPGTRPPPPACGGDENRGPTMLAAAASPRAAPPAAAAAAAPWPAAAPATDVSPPAPLLLPAGIPALLPSTDSLAAEEADRTVL